MKINVVRSVPSLLPVFLVLAVALVVGCGPARVMPLDNVGPNETAFVIPLEGNGTEQEKFESIKYLEGRKVASKRIEIPVRQRDTGYGWWNYEYVPMVRVVKVDRSLVTREWVGSDKTAAAIGVESRESINFHVGVNLTAFIAEEDAPTYLYYHTSTPLADIVDKNVRGFVQGELSKGFGSLSLEECKLKKGDVFAVVERATKEHFKTYGITVQNVGNAQGLSFDDPKIQDAINATANAEMMIDVARKEKLAQDQRNEARIAAATADRRAAEEFSKAQDAQVVKIRLEIERMRAEAMLEAAKKWNGSVPASVLPQGSSLLFGLDTHVPTAPAGK